MPTTMMVFKSRQMSCKHHLHLYFCSDQKFRSRPPLLLGFVPYKEGAVPVPLNVVALNQTQNRSGTTVAEQPRLEATLTNKFAG